MKKFRRKQTTRQFVISFADGLVMPAKGKEVSAYDLYAAYCRHEERFGEPISKARFCRILDKQYERRASLLGGNYQDLKFI